MTAATPAPILLEPSDAGRYVRIRRRMLLDSPWAYGASLDDSDTLRPEFCARMFAEEFQATLAFEETEPGGAARPGEARSGEGREPELIAAGTIRRARQRKFRHRAGIFGVFVDPAHRGRGLGRALLGAALERARSWPGVELVDIGASDGSPAALHLYESLGFEAWGREPAATVVDGRSYDEIHLALRLHDPPATATPGTPAAASAPPKTIAWSDFEAVEIRVGTIVAAEPFPEARTPAYKVTVDFGPRIGLRRTSARITDRYRPEDLPGRQCLGVVNFPVKQIGPLRSEFLLTGFLGDDDAVVLAVPDHPVPNGARLL